MKVHHQTQFLFDFTKLTKNCTTFFLLLNWKWKKNCRIKLNVGSNFWTNQHFTQLKSKSGKRIFFGIFKYLFGCQIIWKMRVLYFFLKTCFFFSRHTLFFFLVQHEQTLILTLHWIFVARRMIALCEYVVVWTFSWIILWKFFLRQIAKHVIWQIVYGFLSKIALGHL